jgi:hypothetical protein
MAHANPPYLSDLNTHGLEVKFIYFPPKELTFTTHGSSSNIHLQDLYLRITLKRSAMAIQVSHNITLGDFWTSYDIMKGISNI